LKNSAWKLRLFPVASD